MTNIKFALLEALGYRDIVKVPRTPSEAAILMYLRLRQLEQGGPATREEILIDTQLSERTVDGAIRKLRKEGVVERREVFLPTPWRRVEGE